MWKKLLCILMAVVMLLCLSICALALEGEERVEDVNIPAAMTEEMYENMTQEQYAAAASDLLTMAFYQDGVGMVFPDYFGGDYILGDTYYILLHNPSEQDLEFLREILHDYLDWVAFEEAEFSYNELWQRFDEIQAALCAEGIPLEGCVDSQTQEILVRVPEENLKRTTEILCSLGAAYQYKLTAIFSQSEAESTTEEEPIWPLLADTPEQVAQRAMRQQYASAAHQALTSTSVCNQKCFGGDYIDGDQLVINVCNPTEEELENFRDALGDYAAWVVFREVGFTLRERNRFSERLKESLLEHGVFPLGQWVDVERLCLGYRICVLEAPAAAWCALPWLLLGQQVQFELYIFPPTAQIGVDMTAG